MCEACASRIDRSDTLSHARRPCFWRKTIATLSELTRLWHASITVKCSTELRPTGYGPWSDTYRCRCWCEEEIILLYLYLG